MIGAPPQPPLTRRSDRNSPAQKSGRVRFSGTADHYPPVFPRPERRLRLLEAIGYPAVRAVRRRPDEEHCFPERFGLSPNARDEPQRTRAAQSEYPASSP
jgi:hypothetical protein